MRDFHASIINAEKIISKNRLTFFLIMLVCPYQRGILKMRFAQSLEKNAYRLVTVRAKQKTRRSNDRHTEGIKWNARQAARN